MSLYWVTGVTTTTSPEYISPKFEPIKVHVLVEDSTGLATTSVEFESPDGVFRGFADTKIIGGGAKEITIPRNTTWRVTVIEGGAAVNLEVKYV